MRIQLFVGGKPLKYSLAIQSVQKQSGTEQGSDFSQPCAMCLMEAQVNFSKHFRTALPQI